jgi:hypothetical protein
MTARFGSILAVLLVAVFCSPVAAQRIGWVVTYGGQPPSTQFQVDMLPYGASYGSLQGSQGSVYVRAGGVPGAVWERVGNHCVIRYQGEVLGVILDYFRTGLFIDHDGDPVTPALPGGFTSDANGSPVGYWLRT